MFTQLWFVVSGVAYLCIVELLPKPGNFWGENNPTGRVIYIYIYIYIYILINECVLNICSWKSIEVRVFLMTSKLQEVGELFYFFVQSVVLYNFVQRSLFISIYLLCDLDIFIILMTGDMQVPFSISYNNRIA